MIQAWKTDSFSVSRKKINFLTFHSWVLEPGEWKFTGERRLKIQAIFPASTVIPPHRLQSIINMYIVQNGKVKNGRMIQNNLT